MTNIGNACFLEFASRNLSMDLDVEIVQQSAVVMPSQASCLPTMPPVPTHQPFSSPSMAPVPTHQPVVLPSVPTHQPVVLPTVPNHRLNALPQSPFHLLKALSHEQQKAGKMIVLALKKKSSSKPTVLKAASRTVKSKHQKGPSPSKKKATSMSPSTHQVHRTAGPVTLNSPISQTQTTTSGNPNDGLIIELPHESEELALFTNGMYSREKKRRPRTQECGDQENPEFTRHQKFQYDEAKEGEAAYNDDDI
jgi:hypothetical protein